MSQLKPAELPALAFIGGGNMAASLIGGLLAARLDGARIKVAQRSAARAQTLRERFAEITVTADIASAVAGVRIVVLAVKPQQVAEALRGLELTAGTTVLSVAAGVRVATLARALPACEIVRAMPNTPALVQAGISGLYAPPETSALASGHAQALLSAAGATCWVASEELLDAVTALSGCGPAYFFLLTEVLREAGESLGLDRTVAAQLARQTFIGAAAMAKAAQEDVAELRCQVTSKGGATEAALDVLESAGLRRIFTDALHAAAARAQLRGEHLERGLVD